MFNLNPYYCSIWLLLINTRYCLPILCCLFACMPSRIQIKTYFHLILCRGLCSMSQTARQSLDWVKSNSDFQLKMAAVSSLILVKFNYCLISNHCWHYILDSAISQNKICLAKKLEGKVNTFFRSVQYYGFYSSTVQFVLLSKQECLVFIFWLI